MMVAGQDSRGGGSWAALSPDPLMTNPSPDHRRHARRYPRVALFTATMAATVVVWATGIARERPVVLPPAAIPPEAPPAGGGPGAAGGQAVQPALAWERTY